MPQKAIRRKTEQWKTRTEVGKLSLNDELSVKHHRAWLRIEGAITSSITHFGVARRSELQAARVTQLCLKRLCHGNH
jgi:hypothetical protein